jgi:DNA-binding response OmpR family regulator
MSVPKILVIDDDPQIRKLFRQVLEEEGMEVVEAAEGREGLRLFYSDTFDLVITDLFMPKVDGLTVISSLKSASPEVKVIGISGGPPEQHTKLLPLGVKLDSVRILKKPVDLNILLSEIRALLRNAD